MKCITDNCNEDSMNDAELFCSSCFVDLSDLERIRIMRVVMLDWRKRLQRKGRKAK